MKGWLISRAWLCYGITALYFLRIPLLYIKLSIPFFHFWLRPQASNCQSCPHCKTGCESTEADLVIISMNFRGSPASILLKMLERILERIFCGRDAAMLLSHYCALRNLLRAKEDRLDPLYVYIRG